MLVICKNKIRLQQIIFPLTKIGTRELALKLDGKNIGSPYTSFRSLSPRSTFSILSCTPLEHK